MGEASGHLFSLIMGINLILIGAASLLAAVVSLGQKKKELRSRFVLLSLAFGPILLYVGVALTRAAFS